MAEYVEKEEVLKILCDYCYAIGECQASGICYDHKEINKLPTIDIVHCKECKYRYKYEEYDRHYDEMVKDYECLRGVKSGGDDWFCANGERN